MHRPLRVPFHLRVWNLIKGILFYNTVYWEKASDGLNMPTLSREERENRRPKADLEIIRPREKPRARLDTFRGAEVSKPDYLPQVSDPAPLASNSPDSPWAETSPGDADGQEGVYVKRRRYKRRRTSGNAGGDGFFRRVFGK